MTILVVAAVITFIAALLAANFILFALDCRDRAEDRRAHFRRVLRRARRAAYQRGERAGRAWACGLVSSRRQKVYAN